MTNTADIMARADELSARISPGVALAKVAGFLEDCFFNFFRAIGWTTGRAWFLIFVIALALKDGFDAGRPHKVKQTPAAAPLEAGGFIPGPDHQGEPGPANTYVYSERA